MWCTLFNVYLLGVATDPPHTHAPHTHLVVFWKCATLRRWYATYLYIFFFYPLKNVASPKKSCAASANTGTLTCLACFIFALRIACASKFSEQSLWGSIAANAPTGHHLPPRPSPIPCIVWQVRFAHHHQGRAKSHPCTKIHLQGLLSVRGCQMRFMMGILFPLH